MRPPAWPDANNPLNRRTFVQAGTATALSALSYRRVLGANERIGLGFIGFGLIGKRHVLDFKAEPDVACVHLSDAHQGRLKEGIDLIGGAVRDSTDFRHLLDDKSVDAVVVSTPDHWHALMTMMACAAGKDVYVEKPLSLFVREGEWMQDVAKRHNRVVQVGTQQRSGPHYDVARRLIQAGYIGKVTSVRMGSFRNITPGFGPAPDSDAPKELDWDMFLGPAPMRPYNLYRSLYHFRWFWDTSGGQMTNLAAHALDIVQWFLELKGQYSVTSVGGRFALKDGGETTDTQDTLFEFPNLTLSWSHREAAKGNVSEPGTDFFGDKGSLSISRKGFVVTPDKHLPPESQVPRFAGAHPAGVVTAERNLDGSALWTQPLEDRTGTELQQFRSHARNFLDCVKSRQQPASTLHDGHQVATMCHLANICVRTV